MCLCPQPSLTERTADDHRQLPARYGAMGSALRGRLANVLLHHVGGHDRRPCFGDENKARRLQARLLLAPCLAMRHNIRRVCPVACSVFFARNAVSREAALERAKAERQTCLQEDGSHLVDPDVLVRATRREHGLSMGLDAPQATISAAWFGPGIPLFSLQSPPRLTLAALATKRLAAWECKSCGNSCKPRYPKINQQRFQHICSYPFGGHFE